VEERVTGGDGLHLHEDRRTGSPIGHDQVDLTEREPDVAGDDPVAPALVRVGGDPLAERTQRPTVDARYRRAPGSSSSMLTSRNESTVTAFRKRAGRYMSQTQASVRRILK
jgi:hypothetical protein